MRHPEASFKSEGACLYKSLEIVWKEWSLWPPGQDPYEYHPQHRMQGGVNDCDYSQGHLAVFSQNAGPSPIPGGGGAGATAVFPGAADGGGEEGSPHEPGGSRLQGHHRQPDPGLLHRTHLPVPAKNWCSWARSPSFPFLGALMEIGIYLT